MENLPTGSLAGPKQPAPQRIRRRIDPAARKWSRGRIAVLEEEGKDEDGVVRPEVAIVVQVAGVVTAELRDAREEMPQESDRVEEVQGAARVEVAAAEMDERAIAHLVGAHIDARAAGAAVAVEVAVRSPEDGSRVDGRGVGLEAEGVRGERWLRSTYESPTQ